MPTIPVNLSDVESYDNLPVGEYLGQIDKVEFRAPREAGKFPQLMATYVVIDEGEHLGRKSSEFVSLSPKAAFRLKKWFGRFGMEDTENLEVDDDTNLLIEPDLVGIEVIFRVRQDGTMPDSNDPRYRTELVSVEDELEQPAAEAETETEEAVAEPEPVQAEAKPERPVRQAATKRRTLR